jgi:hypothetical protein
LKQQTAIHPMKSAHITDAVPESNFLDQPDRVGLKGSTGTAFAHTGHAAARVAPADQNRREGQHVLEVELDHEGLAQHCHERAWALAELTERSADEDRLMILLNQACLYHWSHSRECDNRRLFVATWQASRVHALAGDFRRAARHREEAYSLLTGVDAAFLSMALDAMSGDDGTDHAVVGEGA